MSFEETKDGSLAILSIRASLLEWPPDIERSIKSKSQEAVTAPAGIFGGRDLTPPNRGRERAEPFYTTT